MHNILIVVDVQNDFVDGSLGTKEAVSIIPNVCSKIKNFEGDIYVTKDTHFDNYLNTSEGKKLPIEHCVKERDGWQLNEYVERALSDKEYTIIEKNSFGSLELPDIIRQKYSNLDFQIEIVGLCTDICVVSNALILKANFPENEIKVDASCCAGVTVESHNASLLTMKMCQIDVI
mgnify:FL=1